MVCLYFWLGCDCCYFVDDGDDVVCVFLLFEWGVDLFEF